MSLRQDGSRVALSGAPPINYDIKSITLLQNMLFIPSVEEGDSNSSTL